MTHHLIIQMSNLVCQPLLINRPNLLQQNNRVTVESICFGINLNVGGELCFLNLGCDGSHDNSRAEAVADIVLENEHRTHSTLLGTDDRREISEENITSFDDQTLHPAYETVKSTVCICLRMKGFRGHV